MLVKNEKWNKILEFITLTCMIVGIVIGSGIFVKNDTDPNHVLFFTKGNGFIGIIVWAVLGILCILATFCFIEIASSTIKTGNSTLPNWVNKFISRKTGSLVSMFFILIYMPIIYAYFAMLLIQYLIKVNNLQNTLDYFSQELLYFLLGLTLLIFFSLLNCLTLRIGKYFQIIDTIIKIIPIVLIILGSLFTHNNQSVLENHSAWKYSSFLMATGPILFSFDGFAFVSNLHKETKNKNLIYSSLFLGMGIVVIIYILEATALFYGTKDGSVMTLFNNLFGAKFGEIFNWIFILIILTSINGYTIVGARYISVDASVGLIYNFNKKITLKWSGLIIMFISIIYFIILNTLGYFVINSGTRPISNGTVTFNPIFYFDQLSNVISIFSFIIYIMLLISVVVNRFTKKVKIHKKMKITPFASILFSIIMSIFIGYRIYSIIIQWNISTVAFLLCIVITFVAFTINEILLNQEKEKKKRKMQNSVTSAITMDQ